MYLKIHETISKGRFSPDHARWGIGSGFLVGKANVRRGEEDLSSKTSLTEIGNSKFINISSIHPEDNLIKLEKFKDFSLSWKIMRKIIRALFILKLVEQGHKISIFLTLTLCSCQFT